MSDNELKVWDVTLRKAISMASETGTKASAVVSHMLRRMNGEISKCLVLLCNSIFTLALMCLLG